MNDSQTKKPLVVFFHPYFADGGVERTNIGLSIELMKNDYNVIFVTISPSEHYTEEVQKLGIEFVVLPAKSTLAAQFYFFHWLRNRRKGGPIVVISCQYYVNVLSVIFRPFWGGGVSHILSERNHLDEFNINQHGLKQKIVRFLIPLVYRFADVVISNSRELALDLEAIVGRPVNVVYNPTLNDRLFTMAEEKITEEWFLSLNEPIFISVGRLARQKGFDVLIKAFSKYSEHHKAVLVILGEGPDRVMLEKALIDRGLKEKVIMPGFVNNPYKFIKASSGFVLSSRYEGLPNVLIESLALKVPVISTSCKSGPKEILNGGGCGKLIDVDDVDALADALRWLIEEKDEANRMTLKAEESLSRFCSRNVGDSLIKIVSKF